ncbi:hypothetical protein CR513_11009, partial [Mucuna pruriens]
MNNCKASFQELKRRFTTSPMLILPNPNKSFESLLGASNMHYHSSHQGLGCMLMQERKVMAYASR